MDIVCGYQRDPGGWDNDPRFGTLRAAAPVLLPGEVDLRPYCTETDQTSLQACAGNATADSVEVVTAVAEHDRAQNEGRAPRPIPQLSRLFVYAMARTLHGELAADQGTYIRTCFHVLSQFGICKETDWPYDESKVYVSPSILSQRAARGRKIKGAYRIDSGGQDRLDDIVAALQRKKPVVFGTLISSGFSGLRGSSTIEPPKGKATIGGHAMMVVGYMGGRFLIKNSWGRGWGDGGYGWFSPDYLAWDETWDLWVPTLGYELG